ncbi:MAG: formylglycine-generating enzyme family protein [Bacteroidia bacterium]
MHKYYLFFSIFFIGAALNPPTLGIPSPESPYKFEFGATKDAIASEVLAKKKFYTDLNWAEVELSVNENNIQVNKNIAKIDAEMRNLYSQLRKLRLAANLKQIEQNLISLKEARKGIIKTTETQLQAINYQGLYLAIHKDVSPLDKEEILVNDLRNAITPDAISSANGAFISSITALKNNQVEYDVIYQKMSGSMEPVNSLYTDANKTEGYFAQIRQEKIYPLQNGVKKSDAMGATNDKVAVIDLYRNGNYAQDLVTFLPDADLRNRLMNNWINQRLAQFTTSISTYNAASAAAAKNIAEETRNQLNEMDAEIAKAENDLKVKRAEVQKSLQSIGITNCSTENLLTCITEAEKNIATQMKEKEAQKLAEKEKELVPHIFDVSAQSGDPSQSIAFDTEKKVGVLNKENSLVKNFLQELKIANGVVVSFGSAESSNIFRTVRDYWMYPMTTNQNGYKVGLVLRFKLGNVPPSDCPSDMVHIAGGTFDMGDVFGEGGSDEKPVHKVSVSSFCMAKYELSFAEYDAYCEATSASKPSDEGWGRGQRPVINVSWYDAVAYCNWRSKKEGLTPCYTINGENVSCNFQANGYRLPTEAEWEYAAREGGKKVRFGNGKNQADASEMNFDAKRDYKQSYSNVGEYRGKTVVVNSFSPNALGLYNMSGNVWEWCYDWYDAGYYNNSPNSNPTNTKLSDYRLCRGGSWFNIPDICRAAFRSGFTPTFRNNRIGFRLLRGTQ